MPKYYPGGGKLFKCGGNGTVTPTVAPNITEPPTGDACPPEKPGDDAMCDPAINTESCPYDQDGGE